MGIESTGVNGPFRTPQTCVTANITRSDTAFTTVARLPKGSRIVGIRVHNQGAASDAGTTAVLDCQVVTSVTGAQSVFAGFNAKQGQALYNLTVIPRDSQMSESDVDVQLKYTETGTASTTGGPWRLIIDFFRL